MSLLTPLSTVTLLSLIATPLGTVIPLCPPVVNDTNGDDNDVEEKAVMRSRVCLEIYGFKSSGNGNDDDDDDAVAAADDDDKEEEEGPFDVVDSSFFFVV